MKFIFLLLLIPQLLMADAVIFSGNDVKALKQNIDLFNVVKILSGTVDPSAGGGVAAPIGSIYLSTFSSGTTWFKTGAAATAWTQNATLPISLTTGVTGILPVANGGTGTNTAFTAGSAIFAGASGVYSQNNANYFWDNTNIRLGLATNAPTNILGIGGEAARIISMERRTASGAGNDLTVRSGGAFSGGTNLAGGNLILSSGTSTGTGSSNINFDTATAGTTGTTDRSPTTKMTILGSGNVGIGTTTPVNKLNVTSDGSTKAVFDANEIFQFHGGSSSYGTVSNDTLTLGLGAFDSGGDGVFTGSLEGGFIGTLTNAPLNFRTNNVERVRIDGSGNVGIGTTSPQQRLQIGSMGPSSMNSLNFGSPFYGVGNYGTAFIGLNVSGGGTSYQTGSDTANNGGAIIHGTIQGDLKFSTFPTTGSSQQSLSQTELMNNTRMIVTGAGNVAIGAVPPVLNASALLDLISTTQGFLTPRMTTTQRDAIASVATGLLIYNTTTSRHEYFDGTIWQANDGSIVVNNTVENEIAGGTITANRAKRQRRFIQGTSAPVTVSTTTAITAGVYDGQELFIVGQSDTNTVTIPNQGNVRLKGDATLGLNDTIYLIWDGSISAWVEFSRNL